MRTGVPRISLAGGRRAPDIDRLEAWERSPDGLFLVLLALAVGVAVPFAVIIALHDAIAHLMAASWRSPAQGRP